jgi:catechol 2,3-dioxygenase-like lactoylglutathione lyase family enzyme
MLDHTGIGVADVAASGRFYDAVLATLGLYRAAQIPPGEGTDGIGYGSIYPVFWIDRFHPHSTRNHTAFVAPDRAAVDAFHAAGLAAGGTDNGAPGQREGQSTPFYYAAFLRDPDGNNIEAVCRNA